MSTPDDIGERQSHAAAEAPLTANEIVGELHASRDERDHAIDVALGLGDEPERRSAGGGPAPSTP